MRSGEFRRFRVRLKRAVRTYQDEVAIITVKAKTLKAAKRKAQQVAFKDHHDETRLIPWQPLKPELAILRVEATDAWMADAKEPPKHSKKKPGRVS